MVAIVSPETGLFDEPTMPAIYAATHEKIKAIIITSIVTNVVYDELINIELYILYIGNISINKIIATYFIFISFERVFSLLVLKF